MRSNDSIGVDQSDQTDQSDEDGRDPIKTPQALPPTSLAWSLEEVAADRLSVLLPVSRYILQLRFRPLFYGVGSDGLLQCPGATGALVVGHGEGFVKGIRLFVYVEGVDDDSVIAELLVGAGIFGEYQHAVLLVGDDGFFGDEVHAVADGVDKEDVVVLVGGDGEGEVVLHREHDGLPGVRSVLLVDLFDSFLNSLSVLRILGDVFAG